MERDNLKRYTLLEPIAAGGMGEVFRAQVSGAHGFQKTVAVKRILPEFAHDPEFVVRFVAEAKLTVSLSHANIVQVLDLGRTDEELYLVMEYVDGADLGRLLSAMRARNIQTPLEIALHIGAEALKGLGYAHERANAEARAIVHCDVSPSNLLLSRAGEVKIVDFGVAQLVTDRQRRAARIAGKLHYMAPEQLRGDAVDGRTDLYALSLVLYEMLAMRPAFSGGPEEVKQAVKSGQVASLRSLRPDVPSEVESLLQRAISPRPAERPPSARSMLSEVLKIAQRLEPVSAPDVGTWVDGLLGVTTGDGNPVFAGALKQVLRVGAAERHTASAVRSRMTAPGGQTSKPLTFVGRPTDDFTTVWEPEAQTPRSRWTRIKVAAALLAVGGAAIAVSRPWAPSVRAQSSVASGESSRGPVAPPSREPVAPPKPLVPAASVPPSPTIEPTPANVPHSGVPKMVARPKAEHRESAFLNLYAEPWANVMIDGKSVGATPLLKLTVAAGHHRIRLEHPTLGKREIAVQLASGETKLITADLERGPAK